RPRVPPSRPRKWPLASSRRRARSARPADRRAGKKTHLAARMAMNRTDRTSNGQESRSPNFLSAATTARRARSRPGATAGSSSSVRVSVSDAADLFDQACEHEDAGRYNEAMRLYRRAISAEGPSAHYCYNLANVLYRLRRKSEAVDFYRQSLEHDERS